MRHDESPNLHLRWGRQKWLSLGHSDLSAAKRKAREKSGALLAARGARGGKGLTLGELLQVYELEVTPTKSPAQQKEDRRRIEVWTHYLGKTFDVTRLKGTKLEAFERERREGSVKVPGRKLREAKAKTVREDLAFLNAVFNWASSMRGGFVLAKNPMEGYELPHEINPHRPVVYYEDYVAVMKVAGGKHPLLPAFLILVESLGWRVTAICRVQATDFDPGRTKTRPHGRLLKRAETDKVGVRRWTIINRDAREAIEDALRQRRNVGYLFPAPKDPDKPWSRHYARALLMRAWKDSEVPRDRWQAFHAFRRKWVGERKHLPRVDVASQGAWLSVRTLDIYEQPDEDTLLAVAEEPRKLTRGADV
jgi:hypothetical protein